MDDDEFEKVRSLLAEKLVAAVYEEAKMEGWKYDVFRKAVEQETVEDFRRAMKEVIEFRARKLRKLAEPPVVGVARRFYRCEACSAEISKGERFIVLDARRLCFLCAVILSSLKAGMAKELHGRILEQARLGGE